LSDSPERVSKKIKKKKINKPMVRNREVNLDGSIDLSNLEFTPCPVRLTYEELNTKDADDISGVAFGWLADMETICSKSRNLNGRLSGCLRDRIACVRTVIKSLVDRVKNTGDVSYLRRRNDELGAQLRESKKEESRLQGFLTEADAKNEKLNNEILTLRRRIGSKSSSLEPNRTTPMVKEIQGTPSRTSKKESLGRRDTRRESVVKSLQDCDDRLQAISKCDEKIAKFEEMLKQMRTDLYGSIEAIADKVTRTAEVADSPKRGVPRIISDVQLVPPRSTNWEPEPSDEPTFSDFDTWTEVIGRKSKRKQVRIDAEDPSDPRTKYTGRQPPPAPSGGIRRRAPRNAAVAIKVSPDGMSYAEVIKQARERVDLKELGITNPRMRRAANGGVLIEISGPDGATKADTLATRLRDAIGEKAVVSRPVVKADIRIVGFDKSVKDEVITMMTEIGGCLASEVRVGPFRPMRNGLNMTWSSVPFPRHLRCLGRAG